ncbi:MAG: PEP-CTERM sorting domain-containing protein [Bryobacterales bacterium]|nr:PEP-CTERM sorting domain-containing protein [Bryobacterales bacterium]
MSKSLSSFDSKLAAYALTGGAMIAGAPAAQATLVTVTPGTAPTVYVATGGGSQSYNLDMDSDGATDFIFTAESSMYGLEQRDIVRMNGSYGLLVGSSGQYTVVPFTTVEDALAASPTLAKSKLLARYTYDGGDPTFTGDWQNGQRAFIGVVFGLNTGAPKRGFIDVTVQLGSAQFTINQWGYDQPVPEPSTVALLALGAAGVAALRRKRAEA